MDITITSSFEAYPDDERAVFEAGETVSIGRSVKRVGGMVTALTRDIAMLYVEKGLAVAEGAVEAVTINEVPSE